MITMKTVLDVLIIGAGISGIGMAAHLRDKCPNASFKIIERRTNIGGTWDLFKYPGIRSDSDMSTFGFNFKPWRESKVLADGASICNYLQETVAEKQLANHIEFDQEVLEANYDSNTKLWKVITKHKSTEKQQTYTARFFVGCTGYYNYSEGYTPQYKDQDVFKGQFIHPQHWPEDLDYRNKKIIVIGSGATAITLVPSLVKGGAGHVTMLQRSPSYIASIPSSDIIHKKLSQYVSLETAYQFTRLKNVALQRTSYALSKRFPKAMRFALLKSVEMQVGKNVDMKHFTPSYNPWDQRLCVVPDGDLFKAFKSGKASIETDHIERFVEQGILLKSGKILEADIIVSATGLALQMLGGMQVKLDNQPFVPSEHMLYKAVLPNDLPNAALMIGYINSSWTLKVDLAADYVCRLLKYMNEKGYDEVVAQADPSLLAEDTVLGSMSSGYIQRAADIIPRQGKTYPWIVTHNYLKDRKILKTAQFDDPILKFSKKTTQQVQLKMIS